MELEIAGLGEAKENLRFESDLNQGKQLFAA